MLIQSLDIEKAKNSLLSVVDVECFSFIIRYKFGNPKVNIHRTKVKVIRNERCQDMNFRISQQAICSQTFYGLVYQYRSPTNWAVYENGVLVGHRSCKQRM